MATQNLIQIKRTSVSGRAANTTTLTNAGELALNMTDGIMYSTNGSIVFEIGANNTSSVVTSDLTVGNSSSNAVISNGDVTITGALTATTKSFLINHPSFPEDNVKLQYGSLEGPENGVYVRGRTGYNKSIFLPYYWKDLVDIDSITVQLTPISSYTECVPSVKSIDENIIKINADCDCFYVIHAERKDVPKLVVEF